MFLDNWKRKIHLTNIYYLYSMVEDIVTCIEKKKEEERGKANEVT